MKPDIPAINAAALEYVKRFPLFNVPSVAFSDSDFDETIAAYLPYPIVKVVPLGRTPVESKKVFPSIKDCIRLLNAYAQGDQKLYIELEDRFMKPSKIASRRQFMETVIAGFHLLLLTDPKRSSLFHSPFFPALFPYPLELCEPF